MVELRQDRLYAAAARITNEANTRRRLKISVAAVSNLRAADGFIDDLCSDHGQLLM